MNGLQESENQPKGFATSILRPVESLGQWVLDGTAKIGNFSLFMLSFLFWSIKPPFRLKLLFQQMEFIGVQSLPIIILTSLFSGMVAALQGSYVAHYFNAQAMVGASVAVGTAREAGPVLVSLMIIGRCSSAMAAELGTMRVTEQIDALESMAVNPVQYLVVPRIWAAIIMMPVLTLIADVIAIAGAAFVTVGIEGVDKGVFWANVRWYLDPMDVYMGLIKAVVFGIILASVGTFMGFTTSGGAKGVGKATTTSVVVSSVAILIADYFLTMMLHVLDTQVWSI